ncbi:MAG TPA: alpha-L-rhamnosidase C-terminal domain-containing protein, partial [Draconibacterium sp.]|nr:alpha-L-rhamnosidase C-terminal domain-containing protein [Draconibacterium sp.]
MMLGHLMEWFYAGLGGIYQSENSVAYSEIIIAPKPVGDIKWAKCSFNSPKGVISTDWNISGNAFNLKFEIPKNAAATVILPYNVKSSAIEVLDIENKKSVKTEVENGSFKIGSGKFEISLTI